VGSVDILYRCQFVTLQRVDLGRPAKPKSKTPRARTARGAPKFGFNDQYTWATRLYLNPARMSASGKQATNWSIKVLKSSPWARHFPKNIFRSWPKEVRHQVYASFAFF
jgi:hypothetical protein